VSFLDKRKNKKGRGMIYWQLCEPYFLSEEKKDIKSSYERFMKRSGEKKGMISSLQRQRQKSRALQSSFFPLFFFSKEMLSDNSLSSLHR
jgi:N-glycosylase/DNA lyase